MRMMGHNVLAIVLAAIVIYAIEFVIFGVLIPGDQYMAMTGLAEGQGDASRMPFGAIMPVLIAIGLALAIKWRNAPGLMGGVTTALMMAVLFGFSTGMYSYVYGANTAQFLLVDLGTGLVTYGAAGAVLGAWK